MYELNYDNLMLGMRWIFFGGFMYLIYSIFLLWKILGTPATKLHTSRFVKGFGIMLVVGFILLVSRIWINHPGMQIIISAYWSTMIISLGGYIHNTLDSIQERVSPEELNELFAHMDKTLWQMKHSRKS